MHSNLKATRQFDHLKILARQIVEGFITGQHKSPHHGFSVEFAEHRLHNPSESAKYIDWKVYARTDRLYTKQYEEETNLRCLIAIDCSSSMHYPISSSAKLQFSIYASAAIISILHKQRDAAGLCLFTNKIEELTPVKSTSSHINRIMKILSHLGNEKDKIPKNTNAIDVIKIIAEKIHRRSMVILFSDLFHHNNDFDLMINALQKLKHRKHEVIVFHVTDHKTEVNLDFPDRPHEFFDVETQRKVIVNPAKIRKAYTEHMTAFHKKIALRCGQLKIDFVTVNAQNNYNKVLQTYLTKRAKMG